MNLENKETSPLLSIGISELYDNNGHTILSNNPSDSNNLALVVKAHSDNSINLKSSLLIQPNIPLDNPKLLDQLPRQSEHKDNSLAVGMYKDSNQPVSTPDRSSHQSSFHPRSSLNNTKNTKHLDLQSIDFLTPMDALKSLFSLPYSNENPTLAVHRLGNVLMIDKIPNEISNDIFDNKSFPSPQSPLKLESELSNSMIASALSTLPMAVPVTSSLIPETSSVNAFIPPPAYYMPQPVPQLPKQVFEWNLYNTKFAVASDLAVYYPWNRQPLTVNSIDVSEPIELSACLDMYLDNVIANVPELALALHSRGFICGIKTIQTNEIPSLSTHVLTQSLDDPRMAAPVFENPPPPNLPQLFDPRVIDMDATTIVRFLQENCRRDDGTYILQKSANGKSFQLYDLKAASIIQQKKFKWMLAMICYRFASRLNHHVSLVNSVGKVQLQERQHGLLQTCNALLFELKAMGGSTHNTIRASVLEQLADLHISRCKESVDLTSPTSSPQNEKYNNRLYRSESFDLVRTNSLHIDRKEKDKFNESQTNDDFCDSYDSHIESGFAIGLLKDGITALTELLEVNMKNTDSNPDDDDGFDETADNETGDMQKDLSVVSEIFTQLTGMILKLFRTTFIAVRSNLKNSRIIDALSNVHDLIPSISIWIRSKLYLESKGQTASSSKHYHQSTACWKEAASVGNSLPNIWKLFTEIAREVNRQTSGVSLQDISVKEKIFATLHSMEKLTSICLQLPYNSSIPNDNIRQNDTIKSFKSSKKKSSVLLTEASLKYTSEKIKRKVSYIFATDKSVEEETNHTITSPLSILKDIYVILSSLIVTESDLKVKVGKPSTSQIFELSSPLFSENGYLDSDGSLQLWLFLEYICSSASSKDDILAAGILAYSSLLTIIAEASKAFYIRPMNISTSLRSPLLNNSSSRNNSLLSIDLSDAAIQDELRRLGDGMNSFGKSILSSLNVAVRNKQTSDDICLDIQRLLISSQSTIINGKSPRLLLRRRSAISGYTNILQIIFSSASSIFDLVGDKTNSSTVQCNICSLMRVSSIYHLSKLNTEFSLKDLENSISIATATIDKLAQYEEPTKKLSFVSVIQCLSFEVALSNLCIGIMNRMALLTKSQPLFEYFKDPYLSPFLTYYRYPSMNNNDDNASKQDAVVALVTDPNIERNIVERLLKAQEFFQETSSGRLLAACQYQLGSYYSATWTIPIQPVECPADSANLIPQARLHLSLKYYEDAYRYYIRSDVGPNLIAILLDMCDLYTSSSETEFSLDVSDNKNICDSKERSEGSLKTEDYDYGLGAARGALQSLIECRLAFTSAVLEKYPTIMNTLACETYRRLCRVTLLFIRIRSKVIPLNDARGISENKELKLYYSTLLKDSTIIEDQTRSDQGVILNSIFESLQANSVLKSLLYPSAI